MVPLNRNDEVPVTDVLSPTHSREQRVYRAIVRHAVPYVAYTALIGMGFGVAFGAVGSVVSVDALEAPIVAFYAVVGSVIGAVIAIRPVLSALMTFRWTSEANDR